MVRIKTAVLVLCAVAEFLMLVKAAGGHDLHHRAQSVSYSNWVNKNNQGCCNDQDCHPLPEHRERTVNGQTEVLIEGVGSAAGQSAWCPVLAHKYLKTGNAPDWQTSHVCVWAMAGGDPCSQFICYQPKPGF